MGVPMVQTLLCSAGGCHPFDVLTSTAGSKTPATQPRLTSAPGHRLPDAACDLATFSNVMLEIDWIEDIGVQVSASSS